MDQESIAMNDGVLKSLSDMPSHCGLNSTCKLYCPDASSMVTTVTPGLSWSEAPEGRAGSLGKRFASIVDILAPLGAERICIFIVLPSRVRVADVPLPSTLTVAFVCIRHIIACPALISSCRRICFRPFIVRIPRL